MIIFKLTEKNMHKWPFWSRKGKFVFALASGLSYAIYFFIGFTLIKWILHKESTTILQEGFYISTIAFLGKFLLSLILWNNNEKKYKTWAIEEKHLS